MVRVENKKLNIFSKRSTFVGQVETRKNVLWRCLTDHISWKYDIFISFQPFTNTNQIFHNETDIAEVRNHRKMQYSNKIKFSNSFISHWIVRRISQRDKLSICRYLTRWNTIYEKSIEYSTIIGSLLVPIAIRLISFDEREKICENYCNALLNENLFYLPIGYLYRVNLQERDIVFYMPK